jgi:SAM-dependent methyltransferase
MKAILGGHWQPAPAGWTEFTERQIDITKRLPWNNDSMDAIFTEHVIEHVSFQSAIYFMRESFRTLRQGGVFRVVAPMVEVFTNLNARPDFMAKYAKEQMSPYYKTEISELSALSLDMEESLLPFIVDFMVRKHGHQFCWSGHLMRAVLLKIGFSDAAVSSPGRSAFDKETCLERRIRGTHADNLERDFGPGIIFDPESGVVEARK